MVANINTVPQEIVCDILHALDRNEIEKCQLISLKCRNYVLKNLPILPLWHFNRLDLRHSREIHEDCNIEIIIEETRDGNKLELKELKEIEHLKYCLFDFIWLFPRKEDYALTYRNFMKVLAEEKDFFERFLIAGFLLGLSISVKMHFSHITFIVQSFKAYKLTI